MRGRPRFWRAARQFAQRLRRLEQSHGSLSAIGANRNYGERARRHGAQFLGRLAENARAGCRERMPDRKGAAIGLDALPWEGAKLEIDARLLAAIGDRTRAGYGKWVAVRVVLCGCRLLT